VNNQVTLRATSSRDIRAPNLNDLYAPAAITLTTITDLLTNTSPQVQQYNAGNPNLTPEVSTTWTAGVVYKPEWLPRFSVSVDAYDILVRNAITSIQGTNPQIQTACYQSGGTSPYCALQIRPVNYTSSAASNAVTEWINTTINIAQQHTYGADFEANYAGNVMNRPYTLRFLADYQPHIMYLQAGLATFDMAGVAYNSNALQASPVWRMTAFAHITPIDNFAVDLMERWRSPLAYAPAASGLVFNTGTISSVAYTNLTLTYSFQNFGKTDVYFAIANLFNTQPPPGAFYGANSAVGSFGGFVFGDDPVGREFTLGLRFRY
jgi:outer membrane receptor protein involved in Fe transport